MIESRKQIELSNVIYFVAFNENFMYSTCQKVTLMTNVCSFRFYDCYARLTFIVVFFFAFLLESNQYYDRFVIMFKFITLSNKCLSFVDLS